VSEKKRKILVTSALPYANGPIHIGHLVEYIQTDIWVRFQRLRGHQVIYIGADDAHGTPIMIKAESENITPEQLIAQINTEHQSDFQRFYISFDNYYSTHSPENKELSETIYNRAKENDNIEKRTIKQAFDDVKKMFLPDRMIRGICPKCKAEDQYGDNCENCGSTYAPTELIEPRSTLSDSTPILKESEHYFFDLPAYEDFLKEWTKQPKLLQKEIRNKLEEWFSTGLQQWDISRDAPYFGFAIPDTDNQKYFYVWVDAPIGYFASFKNYCQNNPNLNIDFEQWINADSDTEMHHFIGKDIIYFHSLFWPAMLKAANFRLPTQIHAHGFLTVNGQKMSKSKGTFIRAKTWLEHLDPEPLRYTFASRLNARVEDLDLDLEEFEQKFNGDVVGKVVNIASRCSGFLQRFFDNKLCALDEQGEQLLTTCLSIQDTIANHYENKEYAMAVREIMNIADQVNQYVNHYQPWKIAKQIESKNDPKLATLQAILSACIHSFYSLIIYLQPILPNLTKTSQNYLNIKNISWDNLQSPILPTDHQLNLFSPLTERLKKEDINTMIEAEKS
jgi:methionyl-tRNA synthetase